MTHLDGVLCGGELPPDLTVSRHAGTCRPTQIPDLPAIRFSGVHAYGGGKPQAGDEQQMQPTDQKEDSRQLIPPSCIFWYLCSFKIPA